MIGDLTQGERWLYVIIVGAIVGLFFGIFMRAESLKRRPIYGGPGAQFFHYLSASALSAVIPLVLIALFFRLTLPRIILTGLGFSVFNFLCLFAYGFFESQADYVEVEPERELD